MNKAAKWFATAALVLGTNLVWAQSPAPGTAAPADTEASLLRLEMQSLRSDIEIMKGHIGRLVQYLQQRDAQSIAPQVAPVPGGLAPQGAGGPSGAGVPQLSPQARQAAAAQAGQPGLGQPAAGLNAGEVKINIAGAPSLGRADAPVTIIEFSDFECPFCQRFKQSTLPEIKRDYIDTGKVRYVFLDFPLEQMHAKARKAAEAAHCAGEQGKFWEMHSVLFENTANLDLRQYPEYAKRLNLNAAAFDACLRAGTQSAKVNRGLAAGRAVGVGATPSFIVTKTDGGDVVGGGLIIRGAQPYERYRQALDEALAAK